MTDFTLDTSGAIRLVPARSDPDGPIYRWSDLTPFAQGYVEAMLASVDRSVGGFSFPAFSDLAPATLSRIIGDCEAADHLRPGVSAEGDRASGAQFHAMRQSGLFAVRFPPLTVSLGEDGLIYLAEAGQ